MKSTVTVKKSFVLYSDYYQHISLLSLEEKGMLLDAIFEYSNGKESELSPMANMAFSFIKSQMERDTLKYEERANRSRANGAKGGRPKENKDLPKTQNNPENPVGYLGTQDNPDKPRKPDTVSVTGNVTVTEPVTVIKKKETKVSKKLSLDEVTCFDTLFKYWEQNKAGKKYKADSRERMKFKLMELTNNDLRYAINSIVYCVDSGYQGFFKGNKLYSDDSSSLFAQKPVAIEAPKTEEEKQAEADAFNKMMEEKYGS